MTRAEIEELAEEGGLEVVFFDGLDSAIVGLVERFGMSPVVLYDREKCIDAFMAQGMSHEEAEEWMSVNVEGAWVGEGTPAFLLGGQHADSDSQEVLPAVGERRPGGPEVETD